MKIGTIYEITFSTNRADTGALANADSTPIVRVTENGVNLAYTPSVSNLSTGVYITTIDTSLANGFEVGKRYSVYVSATVNSVDGANGLDSFTIDSRGIDDVLPTTSYTAPDNATISAIQTEVNSHPTLAEIEASTIIAKESTLSTKASQASVSAIPTNPLLTTDARLDNLDAPISSVSGGGGSTPEQIYTYFTTDNREYAFKGVGGGGIIDVTKKHEEIIEKYEKLMKEELKKLVSGIKLDLSPIMTAITKIPVTNISDVVLGMTVIQQQIQTLHTSITKDYTKQRELIEKKYEKEIDKKNSLLEENEYNRKEKEKQVNSLEEIVKNLTNTIEEMRTEHEEEMKMIDEGYSEELKKADDESEEKLAEKFLSLIES